MDEGALSACANVETLVGPAVPTFLHDIAWLSRGSVLTKGLLLLFVDHGAV